MGFLSRFLRGDDDERRPERVEPDDGGAPPPEPEPAQADAPEPGWNFGSLTAPVPEAAAEGAASFTPDPAATAALRPRVVEVIKTVFDPEIPVDIYELGLVYDIEADAGRHVRVRMTLTSPACPSAQQLPSEVRFKVKAVEGVSDATVEVVWDPPWDKDKMSDTARLSLGIF